jgi:hypothetical protein
MLEGKHREDYDTGVPKAETVRTVGGRKAKNTRLVARTHPGYNSPHEQLPLCR